MTSITPKDYCSSWRNQMRYGGPAALMPYIGIMETVLEASMHFESLPSELRLCCCEFLDAGSLARLELCARESLGSTDDSNRAWKQLAAGSSRGALVDCSDKQLAVVTAGVRALFPRSMDRVPEPLPPRPRYCIGDFVFSWVVCWQGENGFQIAAFEHLACHSSWDTDKPQALSLIHI